MSPTRCNHTRKRKCAKVQEESLQKNYYEEIYERFLVEAEKMFTYMVEHFHELIYSEHTMKHFSIRNEGNSPIDTDKLNQKYLSDIQKQIVPWILNERLRGSLFDKSQWKPEHDSFDPTFFFLGYKKTFAYKQYYFQLAIDYYCDYNDCIYCLIEDDNEPLIHFQIVALGWKETHHEKLQPGNYLTIDAETMLLPECYWNLL